MPTNTLPLEKTPYAASETLDFSVYGVVLPVLLMEPTDALFGDKPPVDGTVVFQASATDTSYVQWVRINGTWRAMFMGI